MNKEQTTLEVGIGDRSMLIRTKPMLSFVRDGRRADPLSDYCGVTCNQRRIQVWLGGEWRRLWPRRRGRAPKARVESSAVGAKIEKIEDRLCPLPRIFQFLSSKKRFLVSSVARPKFKRKQILVPFPYPSFHPFSSIPSVRSMLPYIQLGAWGAL